MGRNASYTYKIRYSVPENYLLVDPKINQPRRQKDIQMNDKLGLTLRSGD